MYYKVIDISKWIIGTDKCRKVQISVWDVRVCSRRFLRKDICNHIGCMLRLSISLQVYRYSNGSFKETTCRVINVEWSDLAINDPFLNLPLTHCWRNEAGSFILRRRPHGMHPVLLLRNVLRAKPSSHSRHIPSSQSEQFLGHVNSTKYK